MINRFPHFHQLDSMDCGPACLRMVARFYGKHYRLETLRERCFITREGVSMLGIADAAETIGFRTTGVRTSVGELAGQRPLPCIVHWNQNHFVVLYDIKRNRRTGARTFYVADPASQLVHYGEEEFMRCWGSSLSARGERLGVALLLTPTPDFERIADEPEASVKRDLLFFARYLLPHRRAFFQLLLGMLVGMALSRQRHRQRLPYEHGSGRSAVPGCRASGETVDDGCHRHHHAPSTPSAATTVRN